jgi:L-aminopeptidase/D-esterase-like protein
MLARIALPPLLVVAFAMLLGMTAPAAADQSNLAITTTADGPSLAFDWPALEVGVGTYEAGPTGVTVIRFAQRASVAVDVRGGGPGTLNTDLLRLGYAPPFVDAVVFAGGSSYGEEAIAAVQAGLKEEGIRSGGWGNIAIVTGAIIYDFDGRRLNGIYPDKRLALAALGARRSGVFPLGAEGAGRMAMQGWVFRCNAHSGQGGAFRAIGPTKIAAFTVVNAYGAITDREGRLAACDRSKSWGNLDRTADLLQRAPDSLKPDWQAAAAPPKASVPTQNTTVSLVVTNQKLPVWALQRLAIEVHTSMARAIQPFSTENDGDTLFAASTQEVDNDELAAGTLATVAGEVMWDAILASIPPIPSFTPPATPISLAADALTDYAGKYRFGGEARGEYGGLGIRVKIVDGLVKASPIAGRPAALAGVVEGDVITHLDGESLQGLTIEQVLGRMRGRAGSEARLQLTRAGSDAPIDVTIVRARMPLPLPTLEVRVDGAGLVVQVIGDQAIFEFEKARPVPVLALSPSEFYVDSRYHTRIAFTRDAAGNVAGAVLNPGRWEQKGVKTE